ncbi:hypothetical protein [Agathobacter rectalis]|uniref:hypothetical protein n=1 Tax=Agathobacter rectalis TaxID=39491 RepID=UPI000E4A9020|nr:hypothetical protein [Agathobacter rectalis]RGR64144.1 hypothetical protein DWY32_07165 [Agathobacter rectalis]RGS03441.1 hypothetical protein DWY15_07455 [Agathobacter rectalis]
MKCTIFYSWQSDLPNKDNRSFIENCIEKSIKKIKVGFEVGLTVALDRDTKKMVGTPDIAGTIFDKIAKADVFICDISIINGDDQGRKCPNPNVLLELGYAVKTLGWDRIICFYNIKYGSIDNVPFDLSHRRIFCYNSDKANEKEEVSRALAVAIKEMMSKGLVGNPLRDHMKGRIDYCILEILKQISCILYNTITMSDALGKVTDVLKLTEEKIVDILSDNHRVLGFFACNDLEEVKKKCETIFSAITTSNIYEVEWAVVVLEVIDWIRRYQYIISNRAKNILYRTVLEPVSYLNIVAGRELNFNNPDNSVILLKKVGIDSGKVLYVGTMSNIDKKYLLSMWFINDMAVDTMAKCLVDAINTAKTWLNETDGEFILDPEYYKVI